MAGGGGNDVQMQGGAMRIEGMMKATLQGAFGCMDSSELRTEPHDDCWTARDDSEEMR